MNILFVTENGLKNETFGGAKASIRNYRALTNFSEVETYEIHKKSNLKSFLSCVQLNMPPVLNTDKKNIQNLVKNKNIDCCFFDSSCLGSLITSVNKFTITFFHNCESDYNKVRFGKSRSLKKELYQKLIDRNELIAIEKSHIICTFTKRDSDRLYELYGRKADFIIPLSIVDKFNNNDKVQSLQNNIILFGPAMTANLQGFEWFIKNVSPYIKVRTLVAGKGMETLKRLESDKVKVIGYVDSINDLYKMGSCVAIPLFSGGGMKIKTAEAMMFGKYIFGTNEAFVGYESTIDDKIGKICNNKEEFINSINEYVTNNSFNFNEKSREVFLNNYSEKATMQMFYELVERSKSAYE